MPGFVGIPVRGHRTLGQAITISAACSAALQAAGIDAGIPNGAERREQGPRQARQALGPQATRAAEDPRRRHEPVRCHPVRPAAGRRGTRPAAGRPAAERPGTATGHPVAQGATNAQIAVQLHISIQTVGSQLDRIRDKTGCRRRADLARPALQAGLV